MATNPNKLKATKINTKSQSLYHTLSCFLKCMQCSTLMFKTYCKIIIEVILQNIIILSKQPHSVYLSLTHSIFVFTDDSLAHKILFLLIDTYLCTYQPEKALGALNYIEKKLFGSDSKSQSGDKQSEVCYIGVKYVNIGWQNDIPLVLYSVL